MLSKSLFNYDRIFQYLLYLIKLFARNTFDKSLVLTLDEIKWKHKQNICNEWIFDKLLNLENKNIIPESTSTVTKFNHSSNLVEFFYTE